MMTTVKRIARKGEVKLLSSKGPSQTYYGNEAEIGELPMLSLGSGEVSIGDRVVAFELRLESSESREPRAQFFWSAEWEAGIGKKMSIYFMNAYKKDEEWICSAHGDLRNSLRGHLGPKQEEYTRQEYNKEIIYVGHVLDRLESWGHEQDFVKEAMLIAQGWLLLIMEKWLIETENNFRLALAEVPRAKALLVGDRGVRTRVLREIGKKGPQV